jgi:hypothetical protein
LIPMQASSYGIRRLAINIPARLHGGRAKRTEGPNRQG